MKIIIDEYLEKWDSKKRTTTKKKTKEIDVLIKLNKILRFVTMNGNHLRVYCVLLLCRNNVF